MTEPIIVKTAADMRELARRAKEPTAVVMTMGGLHDGHGELMRIARKKVGVGGRVIVTIFVNPLQFGPTEDLATYPRTFDADVELCARHNVDVVFAPTNDTIYPHGEPVVTVDPGPLGTRYEGAARPTHFRGVLTVVSILLQLTSPDVAVFGEKDYQQLTLVRQMVADLALPVEIIAGPTVREQGGLARSSRNSYLRDVARETALRIPAAINAGTAAGRQGADAAVAAAYEVLTAPGAAVPVEVEYVVVTDEQMGPPPRQGRGRLIITAIVDGTRLLDNAAIDLGVGSVS